MNKLAFSLVAAVAVTAQAQTPVTPTTPTRFGTRNVGSALGADGTVSAKPLAPADKKFIKDVSGAILTEQKYLQAVTDNKSAILSEDTKRTTSQMTGDLKRVWEALATLSTAKGGEMEKEVSKNDDSKVQRLGKEKADKFEKEFFKDFSRETKQTTKVFEASKTLQDAEVKKFAEDWTVTVKGHETSVEAAEKKLSGKK